MRLALLLLVLPTTALANVEIEADVDGKAGNEKIVLHSDGTLSAGGASLKIPFDRTDAPLQHAELEVVSLGGKRRGIWVRTLHSDDEDPPTRHRVFVLGKGALREVANELVATQVKFGKEGTMRYLESGWEACMRVQAKKVRRQVVTLRLDKAGKKMVKTRKPSAEVQNCNELAACPFVYEVIGDDVRFAGEILRYVRSKDLETTQSLALATRATTIRIVEEKLETTYLDAVWLEVDGVRVAPKACAAVPSLPYCAADGEYHVMNLGDVLELEFDAPAGARQLVARGYYIPVKRALGSN